MEALVEYNYEAHEPDELTIRKGDIIKDIKVANGGWWEGTLRDKRGMFPDNFVKVLEPVGGSRNSAERIAKQEEVTLRNGSGRKFCKVLFSYEPCNDDELKLIPDEAIEYLGEVEEGWWKGRIKGKTGVFPSNFVSSPVPEETERNKDKKEYCRVLFPYQAANEDEITIVDGDIITLISRDAPDKGWWKGELKGQVGLFPDNFVEVITVKNDQFPDNQVNPVSTAKSVTKHQAGKRKETANIRKSLDSRNIPVKKISTSSSTSSLSSNTLDKKPTNALISSLKRLVGDNSSSSSSSATNNENGSAGVGLGEELDEVERGEGAPLSHLTASRAKAPRRRLPSTQHLRHHNVAVSATVPTSTNNTTVLSEDNMTNGSVDSEGNKDDDNDGLAAKSRRMAPWVEELKFSQMERRKMGLDKPIDWTPDNKIKKERILSWLPPSSNSEDVTPKSDLDGEYVKLKDKEKEKPQKPEPRLPADQPVSSTTNLPAFVPYHLYSQLLERIAVLEENQTILQKKVNQLTEQLNPVSNSTRVDE